MDEAAKCPYCKNSFNRSNTNKLYCSDSCYKKQWAIDNSDKLRAQRKKYYEENKEKIKKRSIAWTKDNPEKQREFNKKTKARYKAEGKKPNLNEKIKHSLRTRLNELLRGKNRPISIIENLGCTVEELKLHLEKGFYINPRTNEPMTWENWGRTGWHIDHIIPLASFDLFDLDQFKKASHYTNLRPLWWFDNLSRRYSN